MIILLEHLFYLAIIHVNRQFSISINLNLSMVNHMQCNRRNEEIYYIGKSLRLGPLHSKIRDITQQFHHLFWFGDLNYRIDQSVLVSIILIK